jgi:hypothetical protein
MVGDPLTPLVHVSSDAYPILFSKGIPNIDLGNRADLSPLSINEEGGEGIWKYPFALEPYDILFPKGEVAATF